MEIELEELTHGNFADACGIDRDDVPESYVDTAETLMEITDYGAEHHCLGHTFVAKAGGRYVGLILLGEAIPWETDPPEMEKEPFYRLMGFVIDRQYRGCGIGGKVLEKAIERVYRDFGRRPVALGCHKDNVRAEQFYLRHGFRKTSYMEGNDYYYFRFL